jgi:uncharacterized delta-60 repeat protein
MLISLCRETYRRARLAFKRFFHALAVAGFGITSAVSAAPGDPDFSFGAGLGKVLLPMGTGDDYARGVTPLPGGQLLVEGVCFVTGSYCVAKLNADGSLDATFATGGRLFYDFAALNRTIDNASSKSIVVRADGSFIIANTCFSPATNTGDLCLAAFRANGGIDTHFGTNGYALFNNGGNHFPISTKALPDGKIVVATLCISSTNQSFRYFCALRFNADGTPDMTFGPGGLATFQVFDTFDINLADMDIDQQERMILAGRCRPGGSSFTPYRFCVLRLTPSGQRDITFGNNGEVTHAVGAPTQADQDLSAVIAQPDGRILLGGRCRSTTQTPNEFCILRVNASGGVDNAIGATGLLLPLGAPRGSSITSMQLLPSGQYLLGGVCYTNPANFDADFCLMRLHDDGTRDTRFGTNGQVITPIGSLDDPLSSVAYTLDGKIVAAGSCQVGANYKFCLAKFEGGPYPERRCSADIDGDDRVIATVDGLIAQRVMNGVTGAAAIAGVNFPAGATRTTWSQIRNFLAAQCDMRFAP